MTFEKTLLWVKKEVEQELATFFEKKRSDALKINSHCVELVDQITDMTMRGGKRIRAYLCWLGHKSVIPDQVGDDNLLSAMVALELFHGFALIHDDIMDQDKERRGGLTVHEYFKLKTQNPALPAGRSKLKILNAKNFGTSMAILAGDLALAWADEEISKLKTPALPAGRQNSNVKADPRIIYQKMKEEVIYGQTLDVMQMHQVADVPQQKINELKTAWYTVIRPLQIGASIAGAPPSTLKLLAAFGLPVGLLFQLKDDALDGTITPTAFEKAVQPLRARAARALGALHLSKEIQHQCDSLARFVTERTF